MDHFCRICGSVLSLAELEGRQRELCPACGWVYYPQLKVGAGAWIQQDGKVLLLRRLHAPWLGYWNLPAGYVEADESPEQAAVREVREETGLNIHLGELMDVIYFSDDPRGNGLLILYRGEVTSGQITGSHEAMELGYFAAQELPRRLAGGGHEEAVRRWARLLDGHKERG